VLTASQYRTTHVVSTREAVEQRQLYTVLYAMGFRIYGEDLLVVNKLTELLTVKKTLLSYYIQGDPIKTDLFLTVDNFVTFCGRKACDILSLQKNANCV